MTGISDAELMQIARRNMSTVNYVKKLVRLYGVEYARTWKKGKGPGRKQPLTHPWKQNYPDKDTCDA